MNNLESKDNYLQQDYLDLQNTKENVIDISAGYLFFKRLFDVVLSLLGIILLSPLLLVIALIVKCTSKGPAIYKHERIGLKGKKIYIYKYRSMVMDSGNFKKYFNEEQFKLFMTNFKLDNDPRITRIGMFLRKSSLDELPQLLNIFKGDMSIVGPRPIVEEELVKYGLFASTYLSIKPGLTGMWQVNGRSDTTYEERVQMDVKYVKNLSLLNDIKIIFKTFGAVLAKKGAC